MDIQNILILIVAFSNLFLGGFVFFKGRDNLINKVYGFLTISVFYWCVSMVFYRYVNSVSLSLIWCKILYTAPIFVTGSFIFFSDVFPEKKEPVKKIFIYTILILSSLFFYVTLFTDLIISDIVFSNHQEEKVILFGGLYFLYSFYIVSSFIFGYYLLLRKFLKEKGLVRSQIAYVFWGTFLASTLGMFTNLLLPTFGFFDFNWAGQVLSLVMVIFIAYAIVRHRLMDIKLVFRRSTVFILSLLSILIPAFIIKYLLEKYLGSISAWLDLIILVAGIVIYPFARDYFFGVANKYFFSSLYDGQKVIAEVSDKLRMIMDINKVYDFIYSVLSNTFHTKTFAVISYNEEKKEYMVQYNKGLKIKKGESFEGNDFLHRYFTEQNKAIVTEEVKNLYYNKKTKKTIDLLTKLNVEVLAPLNVKNKTIGLLVLGPKESGDMYNDEDFQVLEIIGAQAAVSIDNAQLYSEVKDFNEKLEQKVEDATLELRSTNNELKDMNEKLVTAYEKLHQLDRAKTEFISIASHQLRTPLTSIKGFISLLLDGTYGKIKKNTQEVLEKVFISNERLIKLVEDLLNISRIESGKLVFNFSKGKISDLAKDIVESFELAAKNKKLKLEYRKPKKKVPEIFFDKDKIREVISNLIDNSIKYTKKGTVAVTVESDKDAVRVIISDTGMGIAKGELRYIFEKFQRGKDSSTTHTEGVGLGLYVCEKIIKAHNGRIWAESDGLEKGSQFIIQLNINFQPEDQVKVIGKKGEKKK